MFSHIMVGANDIEASKVFYDAILGVLGAKPGLLSENLTGQKRYMYFLDGSTFLISEPIDGNPSTHGNGSTIGFNVPDDVDFSIVPSTCSVADSSCGKDISKALWESKSSNCLAGNGFNYLTIPEEITPELVLDTLSNLRA